MATKQEFLDSHAEIYKIKGSFKNEHGEEYIVYGSYLNSKPRSDLNFITGDELGWEGGYQVIEGLNHFAQLFITTPAEMDAALKIIKEYKNG